MAKIQSGIRGIAAMLAVLATIPAASAAEQGKLLIWANKDKCFDAWTRIASDFSKRTGVQAKVEATMPDFFQSSAAAGRGPDIVIWAHDPLGKWVADGLLLPVTPSPKVLEAIDPLGWQAFTLGRKIWGYPIGIEAIHLIYNKRLIATPPRSFEEVAALDKKLVAEGKKAILWDLGRIYYSWPLLAANGGYAFKLREGGTYDSNNVGVNNAGALKGANLLARLIKDGVLPSTASREEVESAMQDGRVAMIIDGPWAWDGLRKAGIDFGTAAIPRVAGKPGAPFLGVTGAMVSKASPNRVLATEFIEKSLLSQSALASCNADKSLGVPADKQLRDRLAADERIRGMNDAARFGTPMPNNPEMRKFWEPMEKALEAITEGHQAPKEQLDNAARRIVGH